MALSKQTVHLSCSCEVSFWPDEVDAGADAMVIVTAACQHGCDLSGLTVSVRTETDDTEVATAVLGDADEGQHSTGEFTLTAPSTTGGHRFRVVLGDAAKERVVHKAEPTTFTVPVKAHTVRMNVWDLPTAVSAGEPFSFKAGVKCSAECQLAGHTLRLSGGSAVPTSAVLESEVWPGTHALYYTRVTATAPTAPGNYEWEVVSPETEDHLPHLAASTRIALNVVQAPDFEVTIQAVDREQQSPIKGARIVMHPYRAVSDDHGFARLKVARGAYQIFVSGPKYTPARQDVAVNRNVFTRAELDKEPPPFNPDDLY